MTRCKFKKIHLLVTFFLILLPLRIFAQDLPSPQNYVEDRASVINSQTKDVLNRTLKELEQKTTIQMIILTVPDIGGAPIENYALNLAMKWQLGQKGKDNGILLLVAVADRKYRFEIGYGLEGSLPDSFCGSVGRDYLVPYFKKGDYSQGILQATREILAKISSDYNIKLSGISSQSTYATRAANSKSPWGSIFIFIVAAIIFSLLPRPLKRSLIFWLIMNSGRSSSHHRGGGFGGFGGFSGGGGGSFGGGGASGRW